MKNHDGKNGRGPALGRSIGRALAFLGLLGAILAGVEPVPASAAALESETKSKTEKDGAEPSKAPAPTYERDARPILARHCTICHSARNRDDADLSGGLALDSYEAALAGTSRHKVIVPAHADQSELARRLNDKDEERRMPLDEEPLSRSQIDTLVRWIDAGAPRGERVARARANRAAKPGPVVPTRRHRPGLNVVVPTSAKVPAKALGSARGGPLEMLLPVGPLPPLTALAFRGDGRLLAVGTHGRAVLWDLVDGRVAGTIAGVPGAVRALAFSRDGRRLLMGAGLPARSGVVRVCTAPDGTLVREFEGHKDAVFSLAERPDGTQIASASYDKTVRLWDLASGKEVGAFGGHSDFVYAVAYTPDGQHLLTASKDRSIKRLNARTLKEERTYSGHDAPVIALAVHPDGKQFVSAGEEPQLRWWALDEAKPSARRGGHSGPVFQLAFSADGKRLISASGDQSARLWDGQTGASIRKLDGPADWQYAAALSPDGRIAAACGWDGLARVWNAETGRLLAVLVQPPSASLPEGTATLEGPGEWLAACPEGYIAGSSSLVALAHWRARGEELSTRPARETLVRPTMVVRSLNGEPVPTVSFPK